MEPVHAWQPSVQGSVRGRVSLVPHVFRLPLSSLLVLHSVFFSFLLVHASISPRTPVMSSNNPFLYFDDTNPGLKYSNNQWFDNSIDGAFNDSLSSTTSVGATVQFTFEGTLAPTQPMQSPQETPQHPKL